MKTIAVATFLAAASAAPWKGHDDFFQDKKYDGGHYQPGHYHGNDWNNYHDFDWYKPGFFGGNHFDKDYHKGFDLGHFGGHGYGYPFFGGHHGWYGYPYYFNKDLVKFNDDQKKFEKANKDNNFKEVKLHVTQKNDSADYVNAKDQDKDFLKKNVNEHKGHY